MTKTKVLIICSATYSLINFRKDLIQELIRNNFEVWCTGPDFDEEILEKLRGIGANTVSFNLQRKGLNPIKDLKSIGELKNIMRNLKIDFVFAYTIKPVVYGSFAAQKLNLKTFSLITGLGFTFSGVSLKAKLLGKITGLLYKRALSKNNVAIFQNVDDQKLFLDKGILSKHKKSYVVNGSGINLERFGLKPEEDFNNGGTVKFIIVGRLLVEKGVKLFLDTASYVHEKGGNAEFHLVGDPPDELVQLKSQLKELGQKGIVEHHGRQSDIRSFLCATDVFVLPTYYREGVPRSILEALSVGMPIITTDTPGCKETVIEGENGFLIPPNELEPLKCAVDFFLDNPNKVEPMGRKSREMAEHKFDVRLINADLLNIINENLV